MFRYQVISTAKHLEHTEGSREADPHGARYFKVVLFLRLELPCELHFIM